MKTSKAPRVTISVIKKSEVIFISSRLHNVSHQRTASLDVVYDIRPRTQHIASRHARPGRGDDRAARDAVAPTSRRNPSRGLGRDLGAIAHAATPLERVAFDPSQHLSPSRAHRDRLRRRSRARRAENSRGAVKKEARAIRASNARRVSKP